MFAVFFLFLCLPRRICFFLVEEEGRVSDRDVWGVSSAELPLLFCLPEAFAGGCFPAAWLFAERVGGWAVVWRERLLVLGGVSCGGSFRLAELACGAFCA